VLLALVAQQEIQTVLEVLVVQVLLVAFRFTGKRKEINHAKFCSS